MLTFHSQNSSFSLQMKPVELSFPFVSQKVSIPTPKNAPRLVEVHNPCVPKFNTLVNSNGDIKVN